MSETAFALEWEQLGNEGAQSLLITERARVFGGWLVRVGVESSSMALSFVPDPLGRWDGEDFGVEDYEEEEEDEEDEEEYEEEEGDEEDEEYEEEEEDEEYEEDAVDDGQLPGSPRA